MTAEVLVRTKKAMLIVRGKVKTYADSLRVGIAIDGSRYGQQAVRYVLKHLKLFGANPQLTLIHVVQNYLLTLPPTSGIAQPAFSDSQVRELQDKEFDAALEPARALLRKRPSCNACQVRLVGNAAEELSPYAKAKLDLLVLGSHGYGAFKAAMMGSVATRVTAHSKVPLLLVRA